MNERVCSWGPRTEEEVTEARARKAEYMREYRARVTMTPAQEEKDAVYKELGYRPAGMVGKHLTARPMKMRKGVHGPGHRGGRKDRGYVVSISLGDI
jgi:hypothetical protein